MAPPACLPPSSRTCPADTFHKPGFKLQARILHHLFAIVQVGAAGTCCQLCRLARQPGPLRLLASQLSAGRERQGRLPHGIMLLTTNPQRPHPPAHPPTRLCLPRRATR